MNSLRQKLAGVISRRMGDLNPNDVARKSHAGITAPGLRKILKGESDLKVETLVVIAKALGATAPELLVEALKENPADVGDAKSTVEHARLIEMYSDIPRQCQKDVMDLLVVLQRNHSISAHHGRHDERRDEAAVTASRPDLKLTYDGPTYSPVIPDGFFASHVQYLSPDEVRNLLATLPEKEGRELAQALPPEQVRAFGFAHLISEPETKPPHRQRKTG